MGGFDLEMKLDEDDDIKEKEDDFSATLASLPTVEGAEYGTDFAGLECLSVVEKEDIGRINIKVMVLGDSVIIKASPDDSVESFKKKLEEETGYAIAK